MWITDIRIDGFGVWNTISVDELSPGITLFYGPNEAGKTTLMQFIRAVFYGFSSERRKLYLPPVYGGVPGGLVRAENHNGGFVIERRESEKDSQSEGRVIVLSDNGSRQGQHLLNVLVSGIDESIFNNVFAIGIRELQELATLNDTQAAEQLYNMASGVDRVSLVEVMRHLESSRDEIWNAEQPGNLQNLCRRRDQLRREIGELQRETERWADLAQQRKVLVDELNQLEERITQVKHDLRTVEIALPVREQWENRAEVAAQLDEVGDPEPLPDGCIPRLTEINTSIAELREELVPFKKRRREIRRALAAQPINRSLWDHSCRIEAICEHGPWIASLDDEIKQLREAVEDSERELLEHGENLTGSRNASLDIPAVTPALLRQLNPVAQSLRDAIRNRAIARKVQRKSTQDVDEATSDLKHELSGKAVESFDETLEQTSQLVKLLKRQGELDDRLETIQRQHRALDEEYDEILDDQVQNIRILAAIGLMFVFGFVLTLTGIFGWKIMPMTAELCWGVASLGIICIVLSAAWKTVLERTSQEELEECVERRQESEEDIRSILHEQEELKALIPAGRGTNSARLAEAEKHLVELEEKAPLQQERERAKKQKFRSSRQASGADEELRAARRRWRRALREAALPETLTPKHVRQLGVHCGQKAELEQLLSEHQTRLEKLSTDRAALVERLDQLTSDVGLNGSGTDPQIQLSQLATALAGQRDMVQARRELQREDKQLKREVAARLRKLRHRKRSRDELFAEARVADEEALEMRAAAIDLRSTLDQQHAALSQQILALTGDHCREDEIGEELRKYSAEQLERRHKTLASSLKNLQSHLAQTHQRHGEINQEMKTLSSNKRLAAARFELASHETSIEAEVKKWRTAATTLRLLEEIRETYEVERQPETLSEASVYLERLTSGKYSRIWTPLGKNELRIDDQDGQPLALDVLSRGTREVVFLSLRLALVAAYGRRGVAVPMVLDDVLVNLDASRAEAAVEVLCDFAREGRQLLFFTCHEHVKAMFVAAGVDTRVLPAQQSPGVHVVPLLERSPLVDEVPEPELDEEPFEIEEPEAVEEQAEVELEEEPVAAPVPLMMPKSLPIVERRQLEPPLEPIVELAEPIEVLIEAADDFEEVEIEEEEEAEEEREPALPVSELSDPEPYDDDFWWDTGRSTFGTRTPNGSLEQATSERGR